MPNWCTTHYIATGETEDLLALANTLNTMPNRENGFGRYWAGNFLAALGLPTECCRGTFDPCFGAQACFFGPSVNEKDVFRVDPDGKMRFSTTSAWGRMDGVEEAIARKYPSIDLSFSATDEFGNFHETHNPRSYRDLEKYETSEMSFSRGELDDFVAHLRELCPGLDVPSDEDRLASDEFENRFLQWREEDEDNRGEIYYAVYQDV